MAKAFIDLSKYMAEPITDVKELERNKNDMKSRMELMIMKIQVLLFFIIHLFVNSLCFFRMCVLFLIITNNNIIYYKKRFSLPVTKTKY